jgi:hypothetical protein
MFQYRQWPETLVFPSCVACNHGTAAHDALLSLISRMDPVSNRSNDDDRLQDLMTTVASKWPGLLPKMLPSIREAREMNRQVGRMPEPGFTHQETAKVIRLTEECHEAICVVSKKLFKGIYYLETRRIFPTIGCIVLHWFSNKELVLTGKYDAFQQLKDLAGSAPTMRRSGKLLHDQFEYKFTYTPEIAVLQARFGFAFGLVVFASEVLGRLEKDISRMRNAYGESSAFRVLQSGAAPR